VLTILTRVFESQNFLDPANLANILYQASFVAIIAVPMTLVLISGNFDLSVAATAAISAACVLLLSDQVGIFAAMAISLVPGVLAGLVNAAVVQGLGINAFIVTLAMMTALRGVLLIITGGHTASADDREALWPLKWIENGVWVTSRPISSGALRLSRSSPQCCSGAAEAARCRCSGAPSASHSSSPASSLTPRGRWRSRFITWPP
jgi:ribose/xylose/arabinose/galactoside ABC-type transport system permease subunit